MGIKIQKLFSEKLAPFFFKKRKNKAKEHADLTPVEYIPQIDAVHNKSSKDKMIIGFLFLATAFPVASLCPA